LLGRLSPASSLLRRGPTSAEASFRRRCLRRIYRSRGPSQTSLGKNTGCPAAAAPLTLYGPGWILGFAFRDTLTRPYRLARTFTLVRCCSSFTASSPHGLTAPESGVSRRLPGVQLLSTRGCFQLTPRRTFTSNPVPMPGTPQPHRLNHNKQKEIHMKKTN
jgi:hypothetical protein